MEFLNKFFYVPNIKFHEKPSTGSRADTLGLSDRLAHWLDSANRRCSQLTRTRLKTKWMLTLSKQGLFSLSLSPQSVTVVDSVSYHTNEGGEGGDYRQNSGEKTAWYRGTVCTIFCMLLPLLSELSSSSTGFGAKRRIKNGAEGRSSYLDGWLQCRNRPSMYS